MQTSPDDTVAKDGTNGWRSDLPLAALFDDVINETPDKEAVFDAPDRAEHSFGTPKTLTFSELGAAVWSLACELYDAGIRHGDIVVVQLPNIAEHVIADLALGLLGADIRAVPMETDSDALHKIARAQSPKAYISTTDYRGESFTCTHQLAFAESTLILAFGETEPESAQLIGSTVADIEALDSCQSYVQQQNLKGGPFKINLERFPVNLAQHKFGSADTF